MHRKEKIKLSDVIYIPRDALKDYAKGYALVGSIEQTIDHVRTADLFICSETLEHVSNPEKLLKRVANPARYLLVTTPIDAWEDTNDEHIWAWGKKDVENMCRKAGYQVSDFTNVDSREYGEPYNYGIWVFERMTKNAD